MTYAEVPWDNDAARRVLHFGRWIFLSSALSFVALQTDRLLLGYLLSLATLGIYTIALRFIEALNGLQTQLTYKVLFPFLSQTARSDRKGLVDRYYRIRLPMDALFLPASAFLIIFGADIINLLFDDRYAQAGWMLQVLGLQTGMALVLGTQETLLFSIGYTYFGFARSLARAIWILVGIPIGYHFFGLTGVIWSVALSEVPTLFVVWTGMIKHKLLRPMFELRALAMWGGSLAICILLRESF